MRLKITKGARQFGYLIWNNKKDAEIEKIIKGKEIVHVVLNGFDLGEKNVDRKYHRISLGYKFTRALPEKHNIYQINMKDDIMEVKSLYGKQ